MTKMRAPSFGARAHLAPFVRAGLEDYFGIFHLSQSAHDTYNQRHAHSATSCSAVLVSCARPRGASRSRGRGSISLVFPRFGATMHVRFSSAHSVRSSQTLLFQDRFSLPSLITLWHCRMARRGHDRSLQWTTTNIFLIQASESGTRRNAMVTVVSSSLEWWLYTGTGCRWSVGRSVTWLFGAGLCHI